MYLTKYYDEDRMIGIYDNRKSICENAITNCCASCKVVAMETACEDEVLGVHIVDGDYSCKYLTKQYAEDQIRGIYHSRESLCADPSTKCCASCKTVAMETACKDDEPGIWLAGSGYSCKYLTQLYAEDQVIGIYSNRKSICADSSTKCCASCKVVAANTCEDDVTGVQLASGSYSCKYLTERYPEDQVLGIYDDRVAICNDSTTKCCASCKNITEQVSLGSFSQYKTDFCIYLHL